LLAARALRKPEMVTGVPRGTPEVTAPAPAGAEPLSPGSPAGDMASYLANPDDRGVPRTFTFDNLNFEFGTTRLTPESKPTLDAVARVLRDHPTAKVRLETHTDAVGDAEMNRQLSRYRAQAVKEMLSARGVDASRIETVGHGADKPVAPNDT